MNLVIHGMAEGFVLTGGLGDSSTEPPPAPPDTGILDVVLGLDSGGLYASTNPVPHLAMRLSVPPQKKEEAA